MPDVQKDSQKIAEHSSALFDVIEGFLLTQGVDPRTAHEQAAKGGALALSLARNRRWHRRRRHSQRLRAGNGVYRARRRDAQSGPAGTQ
jgi:hypothetical protein